MESEANFDLEIGDLAEWTHLEVDDDDPDLNKEFNVNSGDKSEPTTSKKRQDEEGNGRRLETKHLNTDIDDYLANVQSTETMKATKAAVSAFDNITAEICKRKKVPFIPLSESKREDLPDQLRQFFYTS